MPGYYWNGKRCQMCECPSRENGFATSCSLSMANQLICDCKQGYSGQWCQLCADGYFGNPKAVNGSCKPCQCNGNIDKRLTGKTARCVVTNWISSAVH